MAKCVSGSATTILLPQSIYFLQAINKVIGPFGRVGWARVAEVGCGASPSPSMTQFGIAARFNATSSAVSEAAAANAASGVVHTVPQTEPVVSAEWLHANLRDPNVLDASWSEDDGEFLIPIEFILCRFLRHDLDCHSHVQVQ
ncbi:uncharacterized protein [Triticum aestivum]|uniref:uncharacterized protein isoform X4 n=1 Tax=Triticum aestivum TaxID=4565 RepID=UPI001D024483|nr:uncharacterized protein LOC123050072 isoform X4 [Triticum aestivum]